MRARPPSFVLALLSGGCGLSVVGSASPPDDGPSALDGGAPGPVDAASRTDGAPLDAATTDSALGWCATHPGHDHCYDFDEGEVGLTLSALAGSPSTLDLTKARSQPSSLLSVGSVLGASTYEFLGSNGVPPTLVLAFDAVVTGSGFVQFGGIELTAPDTSVTQLLFEANESSGAITFLIAEGVLTRGEVALDPATWHRYEVHLSVASGAGGTLVTAMADGATVLSKALTGPHDSTLRTKSLVGLYYSGSATPMSVNVDNVTVDLP